MKAAAFKFLAFALVATIVSCGKKQESNMTKPVEPLIPDQLTLQVRGSSRPLTKGDVANIKETFAQRNRVDIPTELLFADSDAKMSDADRQEFVRKEKEYKYLASPESYQMYQTLRSHCAKNRVEAHSEMSYPLDKVTSLSDLRTNDRIVSDMTADYGGTNCMVKATGGFGYGLKVEQMEPDAIVSLGFSESLSAMLNNQKYADMLNSKGFAVSAKLKAMAGKADAKTSNFENVKGLVTFTISGSYFTAQNEIPFSVENSVLSSTNQNKDIRLQFIQNYLIKMPDLDVTVDSEIISTQMGQQKATVISERYFVNGVQKTKEELEDLFGTALQHKEKINSATVILN